MLRVFYYNALDPYIQQVVTENGVVRKKAKNCWNTISRNVERITWTDHVTNKEVSWRAARPKSQFQWVNYSVKRVLAELNGNKARANRDWTSIHKEGLKVSAAELLEATKTKIRWRPWSLTPCLGRVTREGAFFSLIWATWRWKAFELCLHVCLRK